MNYDKIFESTIKSFTNKPKLLLHACCAPCSSAVLERINEYFEITLFYYNPNITNEVEYRKRIEEAKRLIKELKLDVKFLEGNYEPLKFLEMAKGLEDIPEGGERCYKCYLMRLEETALVAKEKGFDYFTTTLSISPHKNSDWLNEIGLKLQDKYTTNYIVSDFKKKNGYKRSIELSKEYGLYRQDYCGCVYSKLERDKTRNISE